ncbi:MAG: ATP-binding protein [Acidobacteriota bacterium]
MRRGVRPDLWLSAIGSVVALVLASLAVEADLALRERDQLLSDGHLLQLAHQIELDLQNQPSADARRILTRRWGEQTEWVSGLALRDLQGRLAAAVGKRDGSPERSFDLFVPSAMVSGGLDIGPHHTDPALSHSRRARLYMTPVASRRPLGESLVLWGGVASSLLILGLSLFGSHLLRAQLDAREQQATKERLEALGRAGAGLAHQLRAPLATIKGKAQLLLEQAGPRGDRRLVQIVAQAERMQRLIDQLLDFARPPRPETSAVAVDQVLAEVAASHPRVRVTQPSTSLAWVDRDHLVNVLENLIDNALEISDSAVEIGAAADPSGRNGAVRIWVADRGPGPGEDPEGLFHPYVTGRARGTGLGLPIARALTEANGGTLKLAARTGGGTTATLVLPVAENPA